MRVFVWPIIVAGFGICSGCGGNADTLAGRVAIEVTVRIGSQSAEDGNLVLRPEPGVKCPLIKVPVIAGIGRLSTAAGPVPGAYKATYLPNGAGRNISEQLTESGRIKPTAAGGALKAAPSGDAEVLVPKGAISLTVPSQNPATFVAEFDPA